MNGIARKSKRAFIELADYAANLPTSTFDLCIIHRATVNFGVSLTGNAAYKISFGLSRYNFEWCQYSLHR